MQRKIGTLRLGLTFAGCFLGAGDVSGQELWQYFGAFGAHGLLGLVLAIALLGGTGVLLLRLSARTGIEAMDALIVRADIPWLRTLVGVLTAALLYPNSKTAGVQHVNYQPLFVAVSLLMAAAVAVLYFTTNEPKLAAAEKEYEAEHPEQQLVEEEPDGSEELPKEVKRSLVMLLNSIALWYIGYNGVTTWWTTYVARVMGQGLGGASTCLLVATGGAIVSYIPVGQLASRIGRKKTIQGGVLLLAACFLSGYFLTTHYQRITGVMFVVFALVGLAWAAINVNSLPMVVEMCKGSDIGKFTGYYYTFSMAAQVVTPILAGTLLKHISYSVLFPYASFFVACSFVTMCFVRHGDCKVEAKGGLAAYEDMDAD